MSAAQDAYLTVPLEGVRAIEASAGTGKTFTLATLVVRLVLERGLSVERILAVTFTEAATQELRARVRKRLLLAAELAVDPARPGQGAHDDAQPEAALTHGLIEAHLARSGEPRASVCRRLRQAADGIDLAAVFTIHGFCARVLREHALESGQGFDTPELLANDDALRAAIAADLWRTHAADADGVDDLAALWPEGPRALARDLSLLAREPELRPPPAPALPDPAPMLRAAARGLAAAGREHGADFRTALLAAVDGKVLHGGSYKAAWIEDLFATLQAWCAAGDPDVPFDHAKLPQLQRDTLRARTSKAGAGRTPDSPLCGAVEDYAAALARLDEYRQARQVALLHRLRDDARRRLALHKRQRRVQTYDDLIDRLADALDGAQADALVARLRAQYRIALVDEFQDTDPRQWRIFDRVFGARSGDPALFVIGDPKQAIYGFRGGDVETYLAARATAEQAPPLTHNFRSRPAVLRAIDALYARADAALAGGDPAAGTSAFADPRIRFRPVAPGGNRADADYLRNGAPAPALVLWRAPPPPPDADGRHKPYSAPHSCELATRACVAAIHAVLADARAGRAMVDGRPLQPGDIAVLVRRHHEAARIREALAAAGIPAVAAGRQSLFATAEAHELHALLQALLHGADDGRLRAALATVLVGEDARRIAALDAEGQALHRWRMTTLAWRDRLQQGGPLALVNDLCAQHAPRLLGLLDGERRLTNYLQLAEHLQEAQRGALGLQGLVEGLGRAIGTASAEDDAQLLRLESDARRVQVVTLHKSKGLEYPLVFLPYAGIGGKPPDPGRRVVVHDGADGRVLQWKLPERAGGWEEASERWKAAQRAEDARLLYVGLTRARDALWLAGGQFYNHAQSPLWPMIADAHALAALAPGAIVLDDAPPPEALPWLPPEAEGAVPPARMATRPLAGDWWVYSFTQLAHADAGGDTSAAATQPVPGGGDEPAIDAATPDEESDARFGGTRFGVVMHEVFEHADFAAWRHWRAGDPAPEAERARIVEALGHGGYAAADIDEGVAALAALVGHTLTVVLPEGIALAALADAQRRAEIEFQFALAPTRVDRLLALLHAHGLLRGRQGFGARRTLEGLMTGLIDLTYLHDGRWYVLDYKSNRLPGYGPAHLAEAMEHSEYPLQALIYTLALHRWLRFRLGGRYDYARDFGGVRYLFCRGIDAGRADSPGVQAWTFAPELVHALDALFAGDAPRGPAA
ncbi:exodeoxyribonuclease V subunit beta [Pseudoxanthomonas broegbernensis]|uniref:RecBCD enzyme subunit RecB n=1 Tax=Pseudoxanthomonas broegbernensis TaxID=83619 RepID=A0A7V8GN39_9GAMM|nr:exodeoxyribonuclease V subunit beta [Pseudoxanthomonas broegbernensis]KAF1686876.1 exodeoxyribonuclease V subunit beta [Pseudoxanthomonas broegbernensis]MBB6065532.1 exodeoxyribonuclease V beta subunit [Pseudoxanthomonas broegbernensis]